MWWWHWLGEGHNGIGCCISVCVRKVLGLGRTPQQTWRVQGRRGRRQKAQVSMGDCHGRREGGRGVRGVCMGGQGRGRG